MCGIAGFIGPGDFSDLRRMTDAITHRGPDDSGMWRDAKTNTHLGHRRLSIVDLSGGRQPMSTPDERFTIVFNGEIYNHLDLRRELEREGVVFQTDHSDTETLLQAYRAWGPACVERCNGMWAFAVYDAAEKRLFCSRDRFGKKPFFYTFQNGVFAFSSELHSLALAPGVAASVSQIALQKYFAYGYIPAPHSLYQDIWKLPGGHSLIIDARSLEHRIEKYWQFRLEPFAPDEIPAQPEEAWGEELRTLLRNAVDRRLMSDVPLGVFLSGGVDSSAVTAMASQILPEGRLKTFSINFEEESFDESLYSSRIAKLFRTEHHAQTLSADRARSLLPEIAGRLDEPMGDSSLVPTYLLCRHTREHVTVALGGDGADELFAGYDPFQAIEYAKWYQRLIPRPVHEAIRLAMARLPVSHRNMSLDFKIKRTLRGLSHRPALWAPIWMASLDLREIAELFQAPADPEELYSEAIEAWEGCSQPNYLDRLLEFYTKLYLQDDILVKLDRATMLVSLEGRCPFLDIELVNFVRRIPAGYKFRRGQTKYLLKKALEPLLPREILYRPKKGFGVPVGKWLRDGELPFTEDQAQAAAASIGDGAFGLRKLQEHRRNRADERAFLWNLWLYQETALKRQTARSNDDAAQAAQAAAKENN